MATPTSASGKQMPMFRGALGALSNFDTTPFYVPSLGVEVASNEHAFNAFKATDPDQRAWVLAAESPGEAKRRGRKVTLRPGWDTGGRVRAMQTGLLAKFAVPELREVLTGTGDMLLIETTTWHDNYWGDCIGGGRTPCRADCALPGKNMLGELLMALRCRVL